MQKIYFISILLLFTACGQTQTVPVAGINNQPHLNAKPTSAANQDKAGANRKNDLGYSDLNEKVFELGSITHFTDTCSFNFACDCCAGNLVFNHDSTFYVIKYCTGDKTLTTGKYIIDKNTLTLSFSGLCVSRKYNWENESDPSATDFFMSDTLTSPSLSTYNTTLYNNKIKLTQRNNKAVAIQTNANYAEFMQVLKNEQFAERLAKGKIATTNHNF